MASADLDANGTSEADNFNSEDSEVTLRYIARKSKSWVLNIDSPNTDDNFWLLLDVLLLHIVLFLYCVQEVACAMFWTDANNGIKQQSWFAFFELLFSVSAVTRRFIADSMQLFLLFAFIMVIINSMLRAAKILRSLYLDF